MKDIHEEYFEWIREFVCRNRFAKEISFAKLLRVLHNIEFRYSLERDENRAKDGVGLRRRFALSKGYNDDYILEVVNGPCSVLEMMVALAIDCEENIMDDPEMGDRTDYWFWRMISNLGLSGMTDDVFDEDEIRKAVDIFLDRKYDADGSNGGLFKVKGCPRDMRTMEIWAQLLRYLNTIT